MVGFKLHRTLVPVAVLLLSGSVWAANEQHDAGDEAAQLKGIVSEIMKDNSAFVKSHKSSYFSSFSENQNPRATVVTCSDSRVHTHAMNNTPDGDLFMVRNIGNQVGTAEGSVEYGVHHLHTPLLIIVGHVACGAIKAAQGNYSMESAPIRRELDSIKLPAVDAANNGSQEWLRGVNANVNNQVAFALKKFEPEVKAGKLTVIGAIYDFQNAMNQGYGKLVVTNVNGNTDTANVLAALGNLTATPATSLAKSHDEHAASQKTTAKPAAKKAVAKAASQHAAFTDEARKAQALEDVFNYKSSSGGQASGSGRAGTHSVH